MSITTKRVYEKPESGEGMRILVDRLWPRGLSKDKANIDLWVKDLAPSDELRRWYQHDPEKWPEFRKRYFSELDDSRESVDELVDNIKSRKAVFLFSSKETHYNNAVALKEYIESIL